MESALAVKDSRMGVNYGLNKVRFTAPVPVGSRLRSRATLLEAKPIENGGYQFTWNVTIEPDSHVDLEIRATAVGQLVEPELIKPAARRKRTAPAAGTADPVARSKR